MCARCVSAEVLFDVVVAVLWEVYRYDHDHDHDHAKTLPFHPASIPPLILWSDLPSRTHLLTHPLTHAFTYSLAYSLTHLLD